MAVENLNIVPSSIKIGFIEWLWCICRIFRCLPKILMFLVTTMVFLLFYSKDYQFNSISGVVGSSEVGYSYDDHVAIPADMLINTSYCKIPNYQPWTAATWTLPQMKCKGMYKGPPKCEEKRLRTWSYVKNSYLHINITAVGDSGYSWNSIRCCYRVIIRVEQNLNESDMNADQIVRYSDQCFPVKMFVQYIPHEYIRLHCISTSLPTFGDVVYRKFFAVANADAATLKKIKNWKALKASNQSLEPNWTPPPNIIIIGVDSTSRLNAHRYLIKSLAVLKSIGAVELKGHTKIGEHTFPNLFGFLTGYNTEQLKQYCLQEISSPTDHCPFIWKGFDKMGYVTALLDDEPSQSDFSWRKKGFVRKPTDFYIRSLMLAVYRHTPRQAYSYLRCLEGQQIEQVQLDYLQDILRFSKQSGEVPVFAKAWFAPLVHQCTPNAQYGDHLFAKHLKKISTSHQNSIIIFMGDHGEIFGELRETTQGWYEDKLPMMWIYLPEKIRKKFPNWQSSLLTNSNRLTSHFDLYKTLVHILKTFDKENKLEEMYKKTKFQKGQSLFQVVPEDRTCPDAGIPFGYCACHPPRNVSVTDAHVQKAVDAAVYELRNMLPKDLCDMPTLQKISSAKLFSSPAGFEVYVVSFFTNPGNVLFEATVKQQANEQMMLASPMLRVNKMERKSSCVPDKLEKYCYCK